MACCSGRTTCSLTTTTTSWARLCFITTSNRPQWSQWCCLLLAIQTKSWTAFCISVTYIMKNTFDASVAWTFVPSFSVSMQVPSRFVCFLMKKQIRTNTPKIYWDKKRTIWNANKISAPWPVLPNFNFNSIRVCLNLSPIETHFHLHSSTKHKALYVRYCGKVREELKSSRTMQPSAKILRVRPSLNFSICVPLGFTCIVGYFVGGGGSGLQNKNIQASFRYFRENKTCYGREKERENGPCFVSPFGKDSMKTPSGFVCLRYPSDTERR